MLRYGLNAHTQVLIHACVISRREDIMNLSAGGMPLADCHSGAKCDHARSNSALSSDFFWAITSFWKL